jgi:hypothetical protein
MGLTLEAVDMPPVPGGLPSRRPATTTQIPAVRGRPGCPQHFAGANVFAAVARPHCSCGSDASGTAQQRMHPMTIMQAADDRPGRPQLRT